MKEDGISDAIFIERIIDFIKESFPAIGMMDFENVSARRSPKAAAVLVHALHGWINTVQSVGSENAAALPAGLILPDYWHYPPYDTTVLELVHNKYLLPSADGQTLRLTPKGLLASLGANAYVPEILEGHLRKDILDAFQILLEGQCAKGK